MAKVKITLDQCRRVAVNTAKGRSGFIVTYLGSEDEGGSILTFVEVYTTKDMTKFMKLYGGIEMPLNMTLEITEKQFNELCRRTRELTFSS